LQRGTERDHPDLENQFQACQSLVLNYK